MAIVVEHVRPNISQEENQRRIRELELVMSTILNKKVKLIYKK